MRGAKPKIRTLEAGETLVAQGDRSSEVFLILDGMFVVEVDRKEVAEIGPGAVVGERATLEGGARTATLRATTRARVAKVQPDQLDQDELGNLATTHHREGG
jgi:CRP-like cAMP-binding protein